MKKPFLFFSVFSAAFAFADVEKVIMPKENELKYPEYRAVLVIKHNSPAYSLTPQGRKEAEERAKEFKLERDRLAAAANAEKQSIQAQSAKPSQPQIVRDEPAEFIKLKFAPMPSPLVPSGPVVKPVKPPPSRR